MSYETSVFNRDLQVIKRDLKKQDFQHLNIQCNRILSNSYLLNQSRFVLPAFIIRDFNILVSPLKQLGYTRPISTAIFFVEELVSKIAQIVSDENFDNKILWKNYYQHLKSLRPHLLDENEVESYQNEVNLTHSCFSKLIDFMAGNKNLLTNKNSRILENVIIEMTRLYTSYGIEEQDVPIRAFTIAIGMVNTYAGSLSNNEEGFKSDIEDMVFPYVDKLLEIRDNKGDELLEAINPVIIKMIMVWREQSLKYIEPISRGQRGYMIESKIDFSQEKKDQLADVLTKGLEDQLRRGH